MLKCFFFQNLYVRMGTIAKLFLYSFQINRRYDPDLELETRAWMEFVVGEPICPVSFNSNSTLSLDRVVIISLLISFAKVL